MSGDHGITMEEHAPFGVVGAVLPVTHSIPTLSGNVINIVAAGNSVVFNPHPGGARSAALAVRTFNEAIFAVLGIENPSAPSRNRRSRLSVRSRKTNTFASSASRVDRWW